MYHEEGIYPNTHKSIYHDKEATETSEERFCPPFWDSLSCFPATPAGELRVIPCMTEMQTIHYGQIHKTLLDTTSKSLLLYIRYNKIILLER